jgi:predicted transcriptional regulator
VSPTPSPDDLLTRQRRAILLRQLADATNGELPLKKATTIPKWAKAQLGLTPEMATAVLDLLIAEQLVAGSQKGNTKKVAITQAGREALERLTEFVPRPLTAAEEFATGVRAKVASLSAEKVVAAKGLGMPSGKKATPEMIAAFEQTVKELIAEGKLFEHPGGKYGTKAPPTLAEVVRAEVDEKLATKEGPFKPADLSKPKKGANADDKQAHAEALANAIAELTAAKKLFPHPGGKYGQLPHVEPDFPDRDLREVYALDVFGRAPDHIITKADIELAFPGKGKPDLKGLKAKYPHVARFRGQGCFEMGAPATRQTLEQLVTAGDLRADGEVYTLTDAGAERLKQARVAYPVLPPVGVPATPDDTAMRETWEAFVLLRLAEAADLSGGEGVVFAGGYPKGSKLNEATAWVLYGELAKAGHVTARWNGTSGEYTLTPSGLRHLAGLSFDGLDKLTLPGRALTALLAAARGGATPTPAPTATTPAHLEAAVMDIFHRLLRERHANIRMVPIHEVRAEVRARFGDKAASREVFNELLLDMRAADKARLVSITDRSRATEQQLHDSVFAVGETFFYMEAAHATA